MITVPGTAVPVEILHRLALGVEPIDALTGGPIGELVVERETVPRPGRRRPTPTGPADPTDTWPPGAMLEPSRSGRFRLRHGPGVGGTAVIRLRDRRRRYVPRRFAVTLWTLAEVAAAEQTPPGVFVAARARVLRPWLLPGAASATPRGVSGIRGRVAYPGGRPVRWARVAAVGPAGTAVGRAHGDERGEFLLVFTGAVTPNPLPPTTVNVDIELVFWGRRPEDAADPAAPPTDLPVETVPRSANPPRPEDLDNPLLRGEVPPPSYVKGTVRPVERLRVGTLLVPRTPYEFRPP
jgi:hypothetical protein